MPVLDRSALEESPLADLHAIAGELGIDGYRRLRKDDLIDAVLDRQGGGGGGARRSRDGGGDTEGDEERPRPRRARGGRGRSGAARDADTRDEDEAPAPRGRARKPAGKEPETGEERAVKGTIELLGNGSAFLRLKAGKTGDDDVYVSAAQVRRCELVDGDEVTGPMRPPRRSERHPSLVRVATINGKAADEGPVEGVVRFDDLPVAYPTEQFGLGTDAALKALVAAAPFGKGSRVTIAGPAFSGKTETLRKLAAGLGSDKAATVSIIVVGGRPEELAEWNATEPAPVAALSFTASSDEQAKAVDRGIEQARRLAARGEDAVVLIDTLDAIGTGAARRALGAARNIEGGGSLTVIATATAPLGGETTVITLSSEKPGTPDPERSAAVRPEAFGAAAPRRRATTAAAKAPAKPRARKPVAKKDEE